MKTTYLFDNTIYTIPPRMVPAIERYITKRCRPRRFLSAIICNDLAEAVARADKGNLSNLPAYMMFFYNHAPGGCWGSKEKMEAWLKGGRDANSEEVSEDIPVTKNVSEMIKKRLDNPPNNSIDTIIIPRPIEDILQKLAGEIPQKEWDKLPSDLNDNLDYYVYGVSNMST